jgi:hypothetical protein
MPETTNNSIGLKQFLVLAALVTLTGCGGGSGDGLDDNGQPQPPAQPSPPPAPPPAPPPPPPPASSDFEEIQATIFTPICTECHLGANAPQGLRLDADNSYSMLVNVASAEVPTLLRVNPGNANASYLVQKIEGTAAVGGRMPLNRPALSQTQIDLVRGWIAAGAPQAAAPPGQLKVVSTIPAAAESALPGLDRMTIIFSGDLDASLVGPHTFVLRDAFDRELALASAHVAAGRPRVVELRLPSALSAGSYQLEVRGSGPVALADNAGKVLDGDADGAMGGDAVVPFDVSKGSSR